MLVAAALRPGALGEVAVVVGGALLVGAAGDRLVAWPRGAALPVGVMLGLYTIDLALGSGLIDTSLLGPNPIGGARFFGVGNELAAAWAVALPAGLAAALPARAPGRREVAWFAAAGAVVTLVAASGRLGANVGAVFTVGGAMSVATLLLGGRIPWARVALAVAALIAALGAVSLLDLLLGGGAHYTRDVLHAHSGSALLATLGRRFSEAWRGLFHGAVLPAAIVCLCGGALGIRYRSRLPVPPRAGVPGLRRLAAASPARCWARSRTTAARACCSSAALPSSVCSHTCGVARGAREAQCQTLNSRYTGSYPMLNGAGETRVRVRHPPAGPAPFRRLPHAAALCQTDKRVRP